MESKKHNLQAFSFKRPQDTKENDFDYAIIKDEETPSFSEHEFGLNDGMIGEIRTNSGIKQLVVNILQTYRQIKPQYIYKEEPKPLNLTEPCEGVNNNGKDNEDHFLIIYVNDIIKSQKAEYRIIRLLGQGISGQVFEAEANGEGYALKIIKNKPAYLKQATIELKILELLNNEIDKNDQFHLIRIHDYFYFHEHLCIVFELLNENLYEFLQHNHLQGFALCSIRFVTRQILEAVEKLHNANIIHCDLKPENILLKITKSSRGEGVSVKVTDFGSACSVGHTIYKYIQSRYYRAPEVILGLPYSTEIDIWSIGCIAAELYLGRPIFPGSCEFDQLKKIEELLGEIPNYMVNEGRNAKKYFNFNPFQRKYVTKPNKEYYKDNPNDCPPKNKIPYGLTSLDDLINIKRDAVKRKDHHNVSNSSFNSSNVNNDLCAFIHFLKGVFQLNPKMRWNAKQCLRHPFITKESLETFISIAPDDISQYLYLSGEKTQVMNNAFNYYPYYSMMMNNSLHNYNLMNRMNRSFSNLNYSFYYQNNNKSFGGVNNVPNFFERMSYQK